MSIFLAILRPVFFGASLTPSCKSGFSVNFFFRDFSSNFRVFHGKVMWETSFFFKILTAGLGLLRIRNYLGPFERVFLTILGVGWSGRFVKMRFLKSRKKWKKGGREGVLGVENGFL